MRLRNYRLHMRVTRAQKEALLKVYRRDEAVAPTYLAFRRGFQRNFSEGYLLGEWKGMVLGIERDGYTHT